MNSIPLLDKNNATVDQAPQNQNQSKKHSRDEKVAELAQEAISTTAENAIPIAKRLNKETENSSSSSSASYRVEDNLPLPPSIGAIIASFTKNSKEVEKQLEIFYNSEEEQKKAFMQSQQWSEYNSAIQEAIFEATNSDAVFVFPEKWKSGARGIYQLDLTSCALNPQILKEIIFYSPNIQHLNLDHTPISKDEIQVIAQLKDLRSIQMSFCNIDDEVIAALHVVKENGEVTLNKLTSVNIRGCQKVTGNTFDKFPVALTELDCDSCSLTDAAITNLKHCINLSTLNISSNPGITGSTFDNLPITLTKLDCDSCSLTDAAIVHFKHCINLSTLIISSNPGITGSTFDKLPVTLTTLNCSECSIVDRAITNLKHCINLSTLNISSNPKITGSTFDSLSITLTELRCSKCSIDDKAITNLKHCINLSTLIILSNQGITGSTFGSLSKELTELGCSKCSIDDAGIANLKDCLYLSTLYISSNKQITGETFSYLHTRFIYVTCSNCTIPLETLKEFKERQTYNNFELFSDYSQLE